MFSCRWQIRSGNVLVRLMTLGSVLLGCGETTQSSDDPPPGSGGSGGSVDPAGGSGGTGGGGPTGSGPTGSGPGSGGVNTTSSSFTTTTGSFGGGGGFSTTGSFGGNGGSPVCGTAERPLEGCYTIGAHAAAGAGGQGGASGWDAVCWRDFLDDCEGSFEGEVVEVGADIDARWCDVDVFGGVTHESVLERQWLVISDGDVVMRVVLGRPEGELDVALGDTVQARMVYQRYHADFMWGRRLTLTKNGELLAVFNDNLPVDEPTPLGDLSLQRGDAICQQPEDEYTCTYVARDLLVQQDDEDIAVGPDASARFGPYEILTGENFEVRDGGGCDVGDSYDFLIARVKP